MITVKKKDVERWAEHFSSVLNRPSAINDEAINRLPQVPTNEALDDPPTLSESQKAIHLLSDGKAPGSDSIPTEVYKEGETVLTKKHHQLFILMWQQETIPKDFKDASIIHLDKCKWNSQSCENHQGISLLSIAGKILDQGLLRESQCGFRKQHGTIDMVFAARQL